MSAKVVSLIMKMFPQPSYAVLTEVPNATAGANAVRIGTLTMREAAAEVGATPEQLTAILGRVVQADPAVKTLLKTLEPKNTEPLRRDLWEAAFSQVATIVYKEIKR